MSEYQQMVGKLLNDLSQQNEEKSQQVTREIQKILLVLNERGIVNRREGTMTSALDYRIQKAFLPDVQFDEITGHYIVWFGKKISAFSVE